MTITAARGTKLRCKGWRQEALLRLLENNLENGEDPDNLVVYGSIGKVARDWPSYNAIVETLKTIEENETLVIQSGKPIGVLTTHRDAPLVIIANSNIVGHWANSETFYDLYDKGLTMWGGLTAGDWQYIGSQGVIQGTYEILQSISRQRFGGTLAGRFVLTAGLGGMSGSQPLAGVMAGAAILDIDADEAKADRRIATGFLERKTHDIDEALAWIREAQAAKRAVSVGLVANAATAYNDILNRGIIPDIVTDQTAAHDLLYGYIPENIDLDDLANLRKTDPDKVIHLAGESLAKEVRAILAFQQRGAAVFDNGNNIRTQAVSYGVENAFDIPIFAETLRPLFTRAIGPFRWIALSGEKSDIDAIDAYLLREFADNDIVTNWISLAGKYVPVQGLPARISWLGHGERTKLALAVNDMVASGALAGPVAFTRDHLDAGAMTHPNIMTENLRDGSDAISDWPLLNAMVAASSQADLVAIHAGGGGYAGYMQSAGLTITADGTPQAARRLTLSLTNDTSLGVLRYADAGYESSLEEITDKGIRRVTLP